MRACFFLLALMLGGCSLPVESGTVNRAVASQASKGGAVESPQAVSLVKMLSWGALGTSECSVDLEGTAPPAHFTLGYTERGSAPVVIDDAEELFSKGWMIVNRSVRGYGFEKRDDFTALHVDAVERLRCECKRSGDGQAGAWRSETLIHVKIDWESGGLPDVRASAEKGGERTAVKPITIGGRLATYELRFGEPAPAPYTGNCASGFFLALLLSEPIE